MSELAVAGGGDEGEGDDAHGFGGVIHAVAPAHVTGTDDLQFPEEAVDHDWAGPSEEHEEHPHDEETADKADHGREDHGNDDFRQHTDPVAVFDFCFGDLAGSSFISDNGHVGIADLDHVGAVIKWFLGEGGQCGRGGIDQFFGRFVFRGVPDDGFPH